jgi:4a-hydroxytetrahydrobiopterin dehydratase
MSALAERELKPPRGEEVKPLQGEQLQKLSDELNNDWQVVDDERLEKSYKFDNFKQALDFTNEVGAMAEEVDHHPEICLSWGRASITIWTHSIGGLSEADFVFAARADRFIQE